jgi:UDP-2,3-diacylglucosamine pyrophosphatase LpxH
MHYKSIFISDLHLGTRHAKSKKLLSFLDSNTCDNLFLVGDIIDGWALQRKQYWTDKQTQVIRKILEMSMTSKVYYAPGNHDDFVRPFFKYNFSFGSCTIANKHVYHAVDGRRILVTHGDQFDMWMRFPKKLINSLARIGDLIPIKWIERAEALNQTAYRYLRVTGTEKMLSKYGKLNGYDAVICGHTHIPKMTDYYMNTGDWVEHCTVLVETIEGKWELFADKA